MIPLLKRPQTRRLVVEIDGHNLARYGATPKDVYKLLAKYGFTPTSTRSGSAHYDEVFVRAGRSAKPIEPPARAHVASKDHIAFVLPGLGAGGAERVVSILANALHSRGWRITVITFAQQGASTFYPYPDEVDLIRLDVPMRPQSWWRALPMSIVRAWHLRRALRHVSPNVVISFLTRTNVLALLASIGRSAPVIVSERNNPERQDVGPIWDALRRRFYRRASGLVTITQGAMNYFPKAMGRRQWVIPNPVSPVDHRAAHDHGPLNLTAVGRLVPQKGFDLLLRAFAHVAHTFPNWELVIWGDGPERATLDAARPSLRLPTRSAFRVYRAFPAAGCLARTCSSCRHVTRGGAMCCTKRWQAGSPLSPLIARGDPRR